MPVETREVPRPSRFRRSVICVSLVLRSIVAVRGIRGLASAGFLEALDQFQEPLHLLLRADADADVTGRDVPTVAHDNLLFCEKWDQIVAIRAKINQHKVSGARVGLVAELVQLFNEPRPQTKNVFHVALHGFGIADSRFGGNQCGEIDREGGSCTPKNGERVWMRKDCSKTK